MSSHNIWQESVFSENHVILLFFPECIYFWCLFVCVCVRWPCTIYWSCSSQTPVPCPRRRLSLSFMMKWYDCFHAATYLWAQSLSCTDCDVILHFTKILVFTLPLMVNDFNNISLKRFLPDGVFPPRSSRILQPWCSSSWPHQDNSRWEHTSTRQSVCTHTHTHWT